VHRHLAGGAGKPLEAAGLRGFPRTGLIRCKPIAAQPLS
jgi:hypothetical protein